MKECEARPGSMRAAHRLVRMVLLSYIMIMGISFNVHAASPGDIFTLAGGGFGDNGAAVAASIYMPRGLTIDSLGNLFIADTYHHRVRKVTAISGVITTVAGNGSPAFAGDGGLATAASLYYPSGVTVDSAGNLYIADTTNHRIRKVDASTGIITTVAGNGTDLFAGDGALATAASLRSPYDMTVDRAGNLFIVDSANHRIRKVDASTGIIATVAGDGTPAFAGDGGAATAASLYAPHSVAVDNIGNLYIADQYNNRIRKIDAMSGIITTVAGDGTKTFGGDGGAATAAGLYYPQGVAVDSIGNLYIADTNNHSIRKVDASTGIITTVAGSGAAGFAGDDEAATAARLYAPFGVALDSAGNLYIADTYNRRIRKVVIDSGIITTVAGNGTATFAGENESATVSNLYVPSGMSVDNSGNLYIADTNNNRIRKVAADSGIITTVAGNGTSATFAGDGGAATAASLSVPEGVTVDSEGNLYIADTNHHRIRKVDAVSGIITTVAGNGTVAFAGDGGAATAASLSYPKGVAVGRTGDLYIADTNHYRIRKVDAISGIITTVAGNGTSAFAGDNGVATAASLYGPEDVVVDSAGNLYIAEYYSHRIRKVDAMSGIITTVAGNGTTFFAGDNGAATAASLGNPSGVTLDSAGNLYIADEYHNRIRKVAVESGIITTVAGNYNVPEFSGDNGPATLAGLAHPSGVALDSAGNLYIADTGNHRVRKVIKPDATSAVITYSPGGPYKAGDPVTITATFNDQVADAPAPQIALSGANTLAATNMTKVDASHYTYDYTVVESYGVVNVSIPTGVDINGVPLSPTPSSGATFFIEVQSTLSVTVGGNGKGNINSNPSGITCSEGNSGTCSLPFAPGTVTLYASPSGISLFGIWTGCTSSTSTACEVLVDGNKSVSATFILAPKAMIGTSEYDSLGAAYLAEYNSATSGATINLLETELTENLTITGKDIILKGGFRADFSTRSGQPTVLKGKLTINGGSLRVDGITVRPDL